jgi:cell division protein FtsQ
MARNFGSRNAGDEPTPYGAVPESAASSQDELDPRLLDLETEQEPAFHRAQKRVPVRRGTLPRKTADRLRVAMIALSLLGASGAAAGALYRYAAHSWRFRLESSDHIEVIGGPHVSRAQIMDVMGGDIGRNVFFVPLEQRRRELEDIPWVESAAVGRLLPDRIRVEVRERTPVAFAKVGSKIHLVDDKGVIIDLPSVRRGAIVQGKPETYSFPVIVGISDSDPASLRMARMKIYSNLLRELDSEGGNYSQALSEVDLSNPEDVKITTTDAAGEVLIHLGASDFLARYKIYLANVQQWRQQYQRLHSVDLRYERQVILNADEPPPKVSGTAASKGAASPARRRRN